LRAGDPFLLGRPVKKEGEKQRRALLSTKRGNGKLLVGSPCWRKESREERDEKRERWGGEKA